MTVTYALSGTHTSGPRAEQRTQLTGTGAGSYGPSSVRIAVMPGHPDAPDPQRLPDHSWQDALTRMFLMAGMQRLTVMIDLTEQPGGPLNETDAQEELTRWLRRMHGTNGTINLFLLRPPNAPRLSPVTWQARSRARDQEFGQIDWHPVTLTGAEQDPTVTLSDALIRVAQAATHGRVNAVSAAIAEQLSLTFTPA